MRMLGFFLLFFAAAIPLRAAEFGSALEILQAEGQFLTTDGSSYFLFGKDGAFESGPLSASGRQIRGTWTAMDSQFTIEGEWSWLNGGSRRMTDAGSS